MRNLKKILALVLALVMSLSLMATASAADFTDAGSVNDTYALAAKVLNGVEVFRGYEDGSFKPQNNITRAEVAAIVYRIATGDVKDTQAGIYSTWGKFNDVLDNQWFAGYVNYCANAGYIKGRDAKTFDPGANVTGYEVLAMILRAVGYGQNGEFEGANWAINTASIARREGVTKNVVDALLGQPATREMVAELLFQAMFVECVDYNMLTGYAKNGKNLAKEELNLEKEPNAVVIANQWAALDAGSPLAANKTKVERADGTTWTLNWSAGEDYATDGDYATGIKDIGKAYDVYVQDGSKVISLAYSSKNDVKDNEGKANTVKDLKGGLTVNDTTKHFTNFAETEKVTSDYRLEVRLLIAPDAIGTGARQFNVNRAVIKAAFDNKETVRADGKLFYEIVIPAGTVLTSNQISVIKEIFRIADDTNDSLYIKGEIFVGTRSNSDSDDVSNSLSYAKFDETYLKHDKSTVSGVENGNWLQVVDNDGDGVAEYVLLTNYDLDTIVENKSDKFYYRGLDIDAFTPVEINGYKQTVGDVVHYAKIDGKAYVHKADTATATFKAVNYKDETATDTEGKVWEQSAIANHTTLPDQLVNVDELTSYNMYLDDYGYVRAYDSKVNYALLTEMYPTKRQNSAWVVDRDLTAEAMLVGETAVKEYKVSNNYYTGKVNPFYTPNAWTYPGITTDDRFNGDTIGYLYPNWLQPATHMLDVAGRQGYVFEYKEHDRYVKADGTSEHSLNSWTNVAKYTMTEDGINLFTAAAAEGNKPVSDYIRLDVDTIDKVTKTNPLFDIKDEVYDEIYTSALRHYVRAVDETVFFLVATNEQTGVQSIRQFTGYSNVPTLTQEKNNIRSMYAVARNTAANTDNENYWVADVIVIEMYDYDPFESISLIYSNNYKIQGDVKYLQAIDNVRGEIGIIPNNYPVWNGQYGAYGFYGLSNVTVYDEENKIYRADITLVTDDATSANPGLYEENNYNDHGIYYGQVRSLYAEDAYSNYISLDVLDQHGLVVDTKDVRVANYGGAYAINAKTNYNEAVPLLLKSTTINNKVQVGDKVIWVLAPNNTYTTAGFIVDLTDYDIVSGVRTNRSWDTASFLEADANEIAVAQWNDNKDYEGNPNAAWNHEVIIGKRSDNSGSIKTAAPIQRYFAVEDYTLFVNGVEQVPTFSGIMDDSLWHIRYNLNTMAGDEITATVTSGTDANLVLNKGLRTDSLVETIVTNNHVNNVVSWSYRLDSNLAANLALSKLVSTIFASDSKVPSITLPAGTFYVANVREAAIEELTAAAKAETDKLDPVEDAALIKAINDARDNAILAVRKAATLVAIEAAVDAGLAEIEDIANPEVPPVGPVDTTEAMGILDEAYEAAKTTAGDDAEKLAAVEAAYEAAKTAVNTEAAAEGATLESVKAVAEAEAAKIAAAAEGEEPSEPVDTTEAMGILDAAYEAAKTTAGEDAEKLAAVEAAYEAAKTAVNTEAAAEGATLESVKAVAEAEAAKIAAAAEGEEPPVTEEISVTLNWSVNLGSETETLEPETKTYTLENGVILVPETDVKKAELSALPHTVTVGETEIKAENGFYSIPATAGEAVTINISVGQISIPVPQASERLAARTLSNDGSKISQATIVTKKGMTLDQDRTPNPMEGVEFVWDSLNGTDIGNMTVWTVDVRFSAEALEKLAAENKDTISATPILKEVETAPTINPVLVKGGNPVTTGAEVVETSKTSGVFGGKTLWTFVYTVTVDPLENTNVAADTAVALKKGNDAVDTAKYTKVVADGVAANTKVVTITEKDEGVFDGTTLELTLTAANTVDVKVSDPVVYTVTPGKVLQTGANQTVVIGVNEAYAEQYGTPVAITVADVDGAKALGTFYKYDATTGTVTFVADPGTKALTITPVADIDKALTITTTGTIAGNYNVGPAEIPSGMDWADLAITVSPKAETTGLPTRDKIEIRMNNALGTAEKLPDADWNFENGKITFNKTGEIKSNLVVNFTDATALTKILGLDVTVTDGTIAVKSNGATYTGTALSYAVLHPEDDKTLFDALAENVASWIGANQFVAATGIEYYTMYNFGAQPTLSVDDNGSYLVVIDVNSTNLVAVGYVEIEGVEGEAPVVTDGVAMTDPTNCGLTAAINGQVITLTATEGKLVPADKTGITAITMGEANTDIADKIVYEPAADRKTATITVNAKITGAITVTAVAVDMVELVKVTIASNLPKYGPTTGAENAAVETDKYILANASLDVDAIKALIPTIGADLAEADFLNALGFTGETFDGLTAGSVALTGGPDAATGDDTYVIFMHVSEGKVVSAGVCENGYVAPANPSSSDQ